MADTLVKDEAIKYVAVEIINKDDKEASEVVSGLFKGIKTRQNESTKVEETFILVHDKDGSTFLLNADFHNIISVEVLHETMRIMTYFMMGDEDQKTAKDILESMMKTMVEKKMVLQNDACIVDIAQYKEVPKDVLEGNTPAAKAGGVKSPAGYSAAKTTTPKYPAANTSKTDNSWVKKEATPHLWKRRSKKPSAANLASLAKKLDLLDKGKLEINTPVLPGEDAKKKTAVADNQYDDFNNYGCMC